MPDRHLTFNLRKSFKIYKSGRIEDDNYYQARPLFKAFDLISRIKTQNVLMTI